MPKSGKGKAAATSDESWYDKQKRENPDFLEKRAREAREARAAKKAATTTAAAPAPAPAPTATDAGTAMSPGFFARHMPSVFGSKAPAENSSSAAGSSSAAAANAADAAYAVSDDVPACQRCWEQLSASERVTAATLGFVQWSWDASVMDLDNDIEPRIDIYSKKTLSARRQRAKDLDLAGLLIHEAHAVLGMRLHNPVDMTMAQREGPIDDAELEPCFLVRGVFESMGNEERERYTATRWVPLEEMTSLMYDFDENERGELFESDAAGADAFIETVARLVEAARVKVGAAVRAASPASPGSRSTRSSPGASSDKALGKRKARK